MSLPKIAVALVWSIYFMLNIISSGVDGRRPVDITQIISRLCINNGVVSSGLFNFPNNLRPCFNFK